MEKNYSTIVEEILPIFPTLINQVLGLFSSQRGWHQSAISVSLEQLRTTTHTILAHPSSRNIFSPPMVGPGAHKQQHDWLVRQFIIHIDDVLNLAIFVCSRDIQSQTTVTATREDPPFHFSTCQLQKLRCLLLIMQYYSRKLL